MAIANLNLRSLAKGSSLSQTSSKGPPAIINALFDLYNQDTRSYFNLHVLCLLNRILVTLLSQFFLEAPKEAIKANKVNSILESSLN